MSDSVTKFYEMKRNDQPDSHYTEVDAVVAKVIDQFLDRSAKGIQKYGTTLAENNLSLIEWLEHAKEEAMDMALYLQVAIDELKHRQSSIQ